MAAAAGLPTATLDSATRWPTAAWTTPSELPTVPTATTTTISPMSITADEPVDRDRLRLSHAVRAGRGLLLGGGVPPGVHVDDVARVGEVEPGAAPVPPALASMVLLRSRSSTCRCPAHHPAREASVLHPVRPPVHPLWTRGLHIPSRRSDALGTKRSRPAPILRGKRDGGPRDDNAVVRRRELNSLFFGNERAAQHFMILYSMIATCLRHDVNPEAYLADVLIRIQDHPKDRVAELLPHRWKETFGSGFADAEDVVPSDAISPVALANMN